MPAGAHDDLALLMKLFLQRQAGTLPALFQNPPGAALATNKHEP